MARRRGAPRRGGGRAGGGTQWGTQVAPLAAPEPPAPGRGPALALAGRLCAVRAAAAARTTAREGNPPSQGSAAVGRWQGSRSSAAPLDPDEKGFAGPEKQPSSWGMSSSVQRDRDEQRIHLTPTQRSGNESPQCPAIAPDA
jgi:hypothetical protein